MSSYPRGSEWRKWDLQVQTILDDGYISIATYADDLKATHPNEWKLLCKKIGSEELVKKYDSKEYFFTDTSDTEQQRSKNYAKLFISFLDIFIGERSLVCLTDHNYYHPHLVDELLSEADNSLVRLLPGVEINVGGIHQLVIFNTVPYNKTKYSDGIKHFLSQISIHNPLENGSLTVSSMSYEDVVNEVNKLGALLIYPHCNSTNGLFQERGKTDRTHLASQYNYQKVNLLQARNKTSVDTTSAYIDTNSNLSAIGVFTLGTDSRCLRDILQPDTEGNFCWIKADLTFEGLQQIIYEPAERVQIVDTDPGLAFDKPYFDQISVISDVEVFVDTEDQAVFLKEDILLNKNMVAIIGGRGSGKSLLVDYLGSSVFDYKNSRESTELTQSSDFLVSYSKNNTKTPEKVSFSADNENFLDFLFIPQGRLKSITKSADLNDEIKSLLELDDLKFSQEVIQEIDQVVSEIDEINQWFQSEDEFGERTNDKKSVALKKSKFEKLLESITTVENQQKLEIYSKNIEDIENHEEDKVNLESARNYLLEQVAEFDTLLEGLEKYKIPKIDPKLQKTSINVAVTEITKSIKKKNEENVKIKNEFKAIFTGDLTKLLKNVEQYRRAIKAADRKLEEISKNETKQKKLAIQRSGLGTLINKELVRQKELITLRWEGVFDQFEDESQKQIIKRILEDRKIQIKGEIVFDADQFYEIIEQHANMNYFKNTTGQTLTRKERMVDWLKITDLDSYVKFIGSELAKHCEDEEESKKWVNGGIQNILLDLRIRSQYLHTQASATYQGKPINKLSAGQRGTTYLCIQLARKAFSSPIVFDQPEDDLDNEFIINDLVGIFKELKKYRQIIIVTHNANLVVNSDVEQVIVAHNNEENLAYTSGSLENESIIKEVCDVLEGGSAAFEKRMKRYQ